MIVVKEFLPKPILIEDLGMMYPTENSKRRRRFGLYKCGFCGTEFKANTNSVKCGDTQSCGCYNIKRVKESNLTHNLTKYILRNGVEVVLNEDELQEIFEGSKLGNEIKILESENMKLAHQKENYKSLIRNFSNILTEMR